jgi:hypothetical protein
MIETAIVPFKNGHSLGRDLNGLPARRTSPKHATIHGRHRATPLVFLGNEDLLILTTAREEAGHEPRAMNRGREKPGRADELRTVSELVE